MVFKKLIHSRNSSATNNSNPEVKQTNASLKNKELEKIVRETALELETSARRDIKSALAEAVELTTAKKYGEALDVYEDARDLLMEPYIQRAGDKSLWAVRQDGDILFLIGSTFEKLGKFDKANTAYKEAHANYGKVLKPTTGKLLQPTSGKRYDERRQDEDRIREDSEQAELKREQFHAAVKTVLVLEAMACLSSKRGDLAVGIELFDASRVFLETSRNTRFNSPKQLEQWKRIEGMMKVNRQQTQEKMASLRTQATPLEGFFSRVFGSNDD